MPIISSKMDLLGIVRSFQQYSPVEERIRSLEELESFAEEERNAINDIIVAEKKIKRQQRLQRSKSVRTAIQTQAKTVITPEPEPTVTVTVDSFAFLGSFFSDIMHCAQQLFGMEGASDDNEKRVEPLVRLLPPSITIQDSYKSNRKEDRDKFRRSREEDEEEEDEEEEEKEENEEEEKEEEKEEEEEEKEEVEVKKEVEKEEKEVAADMLNKKTLQHSDVSRGMERNDGMNIVQQQQQQQQQQHQQQQQGTLAIDWAKIKGGANHYSILRRDKLYQTTANIADIKKLQFISTGGAASNGQRRRLLAYGMGRERCRVCSS
jgi:hypothetical protein